jgi:hypothetical protein
MIERVAFDTRAAIDDGFGNVVAGDWQEQFQSRAKFVFLRGSETVMAGRLEGTEAFVVQVWANAQTRQIKPDWQMRDLQRGDAFNIRSVEGDRSRALIDLLVESGVATG